MSPDFSRELSNTIKRVSEMSDKELQETSDIIERALVHFLVEQHLRVPGVSASLLSA